MSKNEYPYDKEQELQVDGGHKFPFIIKVVWVILIAWGLYYSFKYAVPDLGIWLNKGS